MITPSIGGPALNSQLRLTEDIAIIDRELPKFSFNEKAELRDLQMKITWNGTKFLNDEIRKSQNCAPDFEPLTLPEDIMICDFSKIGYLLISSDDECLLSDVATKVDGMGLLNSI